MIDDKQQATFREVLEVLKEELIAYRAATREGVKPVELDQPIGRLTRIDAIQQQKLTQATRSRNEIRLKQVEAALLRLTNELYGECLACGDDIDLERLKARPEAPICLECQEELEESG